MERYIRQVHIENGYYLFKLESILKKILALTN